MNRAPTLRTDRLFEPRHWFVALAVVAAGLYLFTPLRSPLAAEPKVASQPLGTPAPQSDPTAPVGAGAMAAGVATLAAARRK